MKVYHFHLLNIPSVNKPRLYNCIHFQFVVDCYVDITDCLISNAWGKCIY
jgi:hypothetical protein